MIIALNKLAQSSQLITLHVNGLERFRSEKLDNILSLLNQMMDLNYGSMENSWLTTWDYMEQDRDLDQ